MDALSVETLVSRAGIEPATRRSQDRAQAVVRNVMRSKVEPVNKEAQMIRRRVNGIVA